MNKKLLLAGASLAALGWFAPASAQTTPAPGGTAAQATTIETVVVSARRRDEKLKDVPAAVTVFSADKLADIGAKDITELTRSTPNLTLQVARGSNSTLNVFMRGVGQGDPLWGFEPGVGLYVDDVYYARPQGAILDVYNVDRVEVLRGPQGTLYGRNTEGGAVKFVTAEMPDTLAFTTKATAGTYGEADLNVTGSVPLGDMLKIGGGFEHLQHGGFGKNLTTGVSNYNQDVNAGRVTAEFRPSDTLLFRVSADGYEDNSNQRIGTRLTPGIHGNAPITASVYDNYSGMPPVNRVNNFGYSLLSEWTPSDEWTFKSITAYRGGATNTNIDFAATPGPELQVPGRYRDHQFTEELQALYTGTKLKGVVGLYYLDSTAAGQADTVLGNAGLTLYFGGNALTHSMAAYTDFSYDVTDRLQLSAGLRFNDDIRAGTVFRAFYLGLGSPFFGSSNPLFQVRTNYSAKHHFYNTSPHLSATYKLTDEVSAYVTYAQGYKSGGFDMRGDAFLTPATSNGYGPEDITSYETGLKGSFFDSKLALNFAAFLEPYKNVQVTVQTPATPPAVGIASNVTNAATAKVEGFELEGHAELLGPLSTNFSVGLADANFTHTALLTSSGITDFALVPKWTGNFQLDYAVPTTVFGGGLDLNAQASYRSSTHMYSAPIPLLDQGAYTLFDANINWTSASSDWSVGLHGKNLTDERYRVAGYYLPGATYGDTQTGFYGDPRTVLISLQYRY
jgi:iron complex outermembrane receptor protein